jgi:hypothetical protein
MCSVPRLRVGRGIIRSTNCHINAHNYVTGRSNRSGVKIMSIELIAILTISKQPIL